MSPKNISFTALGTIILLLIPYLFKWPWTTSDFVVAGSIIFVAGISLSLIWQKAGKYRLGGVIALVLLFVWLWAELAVGIFTNWGS